jgi:hypothetical protein
MTIVKWVLVVLACSIGGYLHVWYAQANYPSTRSWTLLLLGIGFVIGTLVIWSLMPGREVTGLIVSAIVGGIPFAGISRWWFPQKMQTILPKR